MATARCGAHPVPHAQESPRYAHAFSQLQLVEAGTRLELPRHDPISQGLVNTLTLTHRLLNPSIAPHPVAPAR
jgi:hypothetical protein